MTKIDDRRNPSSDWPQILNVFQIRGLAVSLVDDPTFDVQANDILILQNVGPDSPAAIWPETADLLHEILSKNGLLSGKCLSPHRRDDDRLH